MTRCVVNVATGDHYRRGQVRLRGDVSAFDEGAEFMGWTDPLPNGWPSHSDVPYGFKAFSLVEAAKTHRFLLWCDAAIRVVRPLEPLWERISRDGYWLALNDPWTNYQWTADSAYPHLFPDMPI